METKGKIDFKPLSEGLGFHPFSDGLPYAPVNPSNRAGNITRPNPTPQTSRAMLNGAGAVSAGPAQPVLSRPTAPRVSVPVAKALEALATSVAQPEAAMSEAAFGFGYLGRRCLAYFIDSALNLGLGFGALAIVLQQQGQSLQGALTPGIAFLTFLLAAVANWALITAQEVGIGTTLGKRLMGLRLSGDPASVFLRAFFFVPSAAFCGLGLLWAIFDRRRRCWHDVVVDLQPIQS